MDIELTTAADGITTDAAAVVEDDEVAEDGAWRVELARVRDTDGFGLLVIVAVRFSSLFVASPSSLFFWTKIKRMFFFFFYLSSTVCDLNLQSTD